MSDNAVGNLTASVSVVTGSFLSGCMMSLSMIGIPVFLDTTAEPMQLYREWTRMYHYGHRVLPAMALTTSFLYAYASYRKGLARRSWAVFALAAVVTVAMIPFTLFVMAPTNDRLFALEADGRSAVESFSSLDEATSLIRKWGQLHLVRSLFPLGGAVIGLTAIMRAT